MKRGKNFMKNENKKEVKTNLSYMVQEYAMFQNRFLLQNFGTFDVLAMSESFRALKKYIKTLPKETRKNLEIYDNKKEKHISIR
jgi:hypothetical protein